MVVYYLGSDAEPKGTFYGWKREPAVADAGLEDAGEPADAEMPAAGVDDLDPLDVFDDVVAVEDEEDIALGFVGRPGINVAAGGEDPELVVG